MRMGITVGINVEVKILLFLISLLLFLELVFVASCKELDSILFETSLPPDLLIIPLDIVPAILHSQIFPSRASSSRHFVTILCTKQPLLSDK